VKIISFVIDCDGNVSVETEGFTGKGCAAVRDAMCEALGPKAATKEKGEHSHESEIVWVAPEDDYGI
jgi:hypothetical protein